MAHRNFDPHLLSLVHFDFPYFNEPYDGLADELGLFTLTRQGSPKLVGSQAPADAIVSNTPRFGYRCLQTDGSSSFIKATGAFTLSKSGTYEFSFWVRCTASATGNLLTLTGSSGTLLTISLNSSRQLTASSSNLALNISDGPTLELNTWTFIRAQLSPGTFTLLAGTSQAQAQTSSTNLTCTGLTLGGFTGQLDEFCFRTGLTTSIPTEPLQGYLKPSELGGFGTGKNGGVTLASNCVMNTSAYFSAQGGASNKFTLSGLTVGKFGTFSQGDEVMIINPDTGEYTFRTVRELTGSTLTLDSAPAGLNLNTNSTMFVQIPHFSTLIISANATVSPAKRTTSQAGGIVAFRVKGDCTINGKIITHGFGLPRTDYLQLTHSKLIDNFVCGSGGNIFITCGGTFTAGSSARLGATWSGELTGGSGGTRANGGNGGAGYGGGGGGDVDNSGTGGAGGVGGGGGGADGGTGGDAGSAGVRGNPLGQAGTGGGGAAHLGNSREVSAGGTQGINASALTATAASGGGGAGGNGGNVTDNGGISPACAGANLILVAKTLKADSAAISTGGQGGSCTSKNGAGGAGSGFCYIAAGRCA